MHGDKATPLLRARLGRAARQARSCLCSRRSLGIDQEEERYAYTEDMAVRRGTAGVRGSHRGLREQQQLACHRRPPPRRHRRQRRGVDELVGLELAAPAGAVASVATLVPAAIKSKGTLTVASDASYAPNEFFASDGNTVVGMDADLRRRSAAVMGLKVNIVNVTFDDIIPGMAAGKYDMGASSFTDTKAREKVVNFVDYSTSANRSITKASGGTTIKRHSPTSAARPCRSRRARPRRPTRPLRARSAPRPARPGVTVLTFPNQNGANLALSSGRAQLGFADSPVAAYQVKQSNGQFKLVGQPTARRRTASRCRRAAAWTSRCWRRCKVLIKNGTYSRSSPSGGVQSIEISPRRGEDQRRHQLAVRSSRLRGEHGSELTSS